MPNSQALSALRNNRPWDAMSPENSDAGPEEVTIYVVAVASRHEAEEATLSDRNNYDNEIQPTSTGSSQTKCSICHSTFRRPEHLKRHFRSHTKEKPFECTQCGRHFSRTYVSSNFQQRRILYLANRLQLTLTSDTLHRHELSHHTLGPEGGKDRTHRITVKTFRACFKCAVARVRCSGGTPCIRCDNRSLECQYPTERRSKAKARKQSSRNQDSVDGSPQEQVSRHARSPSAANTDITLALNGGKPSSQIPGYQLGQFQIQMSGQSSSKTTSSSREHLSEHLNDPQDSRQASEPENLDLSNNSGVIDITRFPFDSYAGVNLQQLYPQMPTSDIRATLSGDQGARLNHQVQPEVPGSNINMGMVVAHNQQLQLGFTQPYLDPAMASTINWLSNDLLLNTTGERPTGDRPPPHSSQGGTIDSSLGQSSWLPPVISAEQTSPSLPEHIYQTPSGNTSLGTDVDSPRHFPRDAAQSSTPQSRPCNASQRSADSYIDGGGARLPKYRRKQDPGLRPASIVDVRFQLCPTGGPSKFSFPTIQGLREEISSEEVASKFQIEPAMYDNIYQGFIQLCCTENFLYSKFENKNFPPREALSHFIGLYFDSFQTVYPILHGPTFNPNSCHWLLTMAVSAIGSYAAGIDEQDNCSAAFSDIGELVNLSTREGLLCASTQSRLSSMDTSHDTRWAIWIEDETRKRTGYFIWVRYKSRNLSEHIVDKDNSFWTVCLRTTSKVGYCSPLMMVKLHYHQARASGEQAPLMPGQDFTKRLQVFPDIKSRGGPDENLPSEPTFFHIDRPCDDELVQIFVRGGQGMKGNVTGVGDICAPEGPERILQVGCETLAGLTSWGISKRFIAILTRLGDLMSCDK
ncbi:unnamed protein product [Aspergillus oryzae]|nr:unnamed protein product [Aspergillus oryzae]